jgi:hypothetical protein
MRKKIFVTILLIMILASCNSINDEEKTPKIINIKIKGALQSNYHVGCIRIEKLKNIYTPADLYPAARLCLKEEKLDKASMIFLVAGLYSKYDSARIHDKSAAQARSILILKNMSGLDKKVNNNWKKVINNIIDGETEEHNIFCKEIEKLGKPLYRPDYMILHGMQAFFSDFDIDNALIENFDGDIMWTKLLKAIDC